MIRLYLSRAAMEIIGIQRYCMMLSVPCSFTITLTITIIISLVLYASKELAFQHIFLAHHSTYLSTHIFSSLPHQ
jgi:hypothetical protein